jgi:murein L,D-transpeptidase YafK
VKTNITRRGLVAGGTASAALALSGCGAPKFLAYDGPQVTRVVVQKADRRMYLLHHRSILEAYRVQLGFAPEGHKYRSGDGRTPEGRYWIDRRNPDSAFFLSIGISYPNAADRAFAEARGLDPGGDIFVHGWGEHGGRHDWTLGCVAVRDHEMRHVYAMVRNGTPIDINP